MNLTIVDTNGKVLQTGTDGVKVVSECGVDLMSFSEVSDTECINVFITQGEEFKARGFLPPDADTVSDLEILIPRGDMG